MSLDLALVVARSGLRLLDRQMARTAQDISNAGTEGHTRKVLAGDSSTVQGTGNGVRARPVARDVDLALMAAEMRAAGDAAGGALRIRLLGRVEAAHGRPEDGDSLGGLVSGLHGAFVGLREAPADPIRRQGVLAAASTLAERIQGVARAIAGARQEAQDALSGEARAANDALAEVASLTQEMRRELAFGRSAADLEDKRDVAIGRLAESLDVTAVRRQDGDITLIARGGLVLPLDGRPAFEAPDATLGPDAFHGEGGTLPGVALRGEDVTRRLRGGRMAAAAELRDATLPRLQAELDLLAAQLARRFDAQGLTLFADGAGTVPDVTLPYAGGPMLGFAAAIRVNPAIEADARLLRDGTHEADGFVPNPAGGPAGFDALLERILGFSFGAASAPGVPQPGFATTGLGPDGTLSSPLSGLATLEAYAGALVSAQSGARAAAEEARDRAATLQAALAERVAARSGVDVDREVAQMVELQTAYGVNARVVSTLQAMWDALFAAVR